MSYKKYHIHFVGIGGAGMSAIAKLLLKMGYFVSGSDLNPSDFTKEIKVLGGIIFTGHNLKHIEGADILVVSSAINRDNVEIIAAVSKDIPIFSRAKILLELIKKKYNILISGSHGKTSTTALIGALLFEAKFDPTTIIGGVIRGINSNLILGNSIFSIVEVDESDGSFVNYSPDIAVVTNIDREHLDFFLDTEFLKKTFSNFINKIPFAGFSVLCTDDQYVQDIIPNINKKKYISYGIKFNADIQAINILYKKMGSQFDVILLGNKIGSIFLNIPGLHNVYNALSAIAIAIKLNISFDIIKNSMRQAKGVERRLEIKGKKKGITVIDDYGHHPTEISQTLMTIKRSWPKNCKVVVFQPHRPSRMENLFDEFANSFQGIDVLLLLPIYRASEVKLGIVNSQLLCEAIKIKKLFKVYYVETFDDCIQKLRNMLKKGDILLTLGAGDVYKIGEKILDV